MALFEERRAGFEAGFTYEERQRFELWMRAVRALARWASDVTGRDDAARTAYTATLLDLACASGDAGLVASRVEADAGPYADELALKEQLADFLLVARMAHAKI